MKRFEILLVQIFAVVGSYLIISMPFVFGFQVSVFTSGMQEFQTSIPDFTQLIEKEFSYPYRMNLQYVRLTLSSRDPGNTIKKVYLYRCKDYNPVECLQNGILPVISVSPFNATLWFNDETKWNDVQRNGVANFLILVKMDMGGREVWTGSWDVVEQTGVGQFTEKSYNLDKLNVYLKPGVNGEMVKNYIESYLSIPTNWVDHSVLTLIDGSSVSKLYELTGNDDEIDPAGTGTPDFYTGILTGNSFNGSSKNWAFIFGGDGKISNPVTFYNTRGEAPPSITGAKLKIDNWSPQAVVCGGRDVINVTAHVENASAINCGEAECYFQDYYYTIDGVQSSPGSMTCSIVNPLETIYEYECAIPVDRFPVCPAPKTSTLSLHFVYKNNVVLSGEFPITLQRPAPTLVVNSIIPSIFDCGLDTELTANLRVTNPPSGTPNTYYTFDGVNFERMSCTGSGETFLCKIPESEICSLLQEDLNLIFKFEYAEEDVLSDPVNLHVTFPPPSLGIDTVTPEVFISGENTSAEVLLHVNYPDSITYDETDFKYKYLDNPFQSVTCPLANSFTNIKYHKCSIELDIPPGREGVEELTFRLDGYYGNELKSLITNYFITIESPPPEPSLTIVSTSSPLDCVKDSTLSVQARVENIQGTPQTTLYSIDGGQNFELITCSGVGDTYTCYIPKDDLCSLMTNSLDLILKFTYSNKELVSNSQKIYINLPEPHMEVYSVFPDVLQVGKTIQTTVNLYIQYPETVGTPEFVYSYLDKADQSMSCQKVSSTSIRDYYRCSQTSFTIPSDYSGDQISVTFAVEGTTLTYPYTLKVTSEEIGVEPWFDIYSTIPGKIEVEMGNSTQATLLLTVHNAAENNLKHSATLQPTKWVTAGTCKETDIDYDFSCDVTIRAPKDAKIGENEAEVKIKVSDGKSYTLTNTTKVYVLPGKFYLDIQTITPDKLYCQGHKQQNPNQVKLNAKLVNLQADLLLQEKITFNGYEIEHTDRYCTFQAGSVTCNIPTDKLMEKVTCGQGDLAPGEGLHYYPLSLTILFRKGEENVQVSGSKDLGVEAIPLQPYIEIVDTDIENGFLKEPINCLGSKTIKLGEAGGYVRIRYADLLHQTPDEKDLTWSFRLDAYDERGKLTKGMGVSPTANATICKMKRYQQVGVHRYEDYECTLFVDRKMFQRCASGEGTITLTAQSKTMGKTAEGEFNVEISRGEEDFNLFIQVEKEASDEITCWIVTEDCRCNLDHSQLNTTISIKNRAKGDIGDLKLMDTDIQFRGGDVDVDVYSPYCRETSPGSKRYLCGFGIRPGLNLKERYGTCNKTDQTFTDIDLGELELTALVNYADGLAEDTLKARIGRVKVKPERDPSFVDFLKQKEQMKGVMKTIKTITKVILFVGGFCLTCAAGTWIYQKATKEDKDKQSPYEPSDYIPEAGKRIGFAETTFRGCEKACGGSYTCVEGPTCGIFYEHNSDGDYPLGCFEDTPLCCCLKEPTEWEPQLFPESKSGGFGGIWTVHNAIEENQKKLEGCKDWTCAIIVLVVVLGLIAIFEGFLKETLGGEYTKWLKHGLTAGLICILSKAFGDLIQHGDKGKGFGKALSYIGTGLYKACLWLAKAFPALIALLNVVTRWIAMMACIEDIQRSLEQGYYGGRGTTGAFRSGLVGTQSAISRLQGCLNQLEYIARDTWRIGQSMYYAGVGLWGEVRLELTSSRTKDTIEDGHILCPGEYIKYKARNWCKVVLDKGADASRIEIRDESGEICRSVSIISPETCYSYYGGYGYGYWGWGWSNTYRPMYKPPGTTEGRLYPLKECGDTGEKDEDHTYQISIPGTGEYYTIYYRPDDPECG